MSDFAAILPFPIRAEDRLRRATRALDAALERQAGATRALRASVADLGASVRGLADSLDAYDSVLQRAGVAAETARGAAVRLDGIADRLMVRVSA